MQKTKIVGYIAITVAVLKAIQDALTGNFSIQNDFGAIAMALGGSGSIFLRSAIAKIESLLGQVKQ